MTLRQLAAILYARKRILLLVLAVTIGTAGALSVLLPPRYESTAIVYVDLGTADRISSEVLPLLHASGYMATQVDIIRSPRVALGVVNALGLADKPEMREAFTRDTGGTGSFERWIAEQLLKKLEVRPSRESSVISISYVAPDPVLAADIANAFADAYIATQIRLRVEPAQRSADIFGARSQALREDVDKAQGRLSEYQRQQGIVVTDERLDNELARLDLLTRQLTEAQALSAEARARQRLAASFAAQNADVSVLPEGLANPAITALKAELLRQETRLRELAARLGSNHPTYLAAAAEAEGTRQRYDAEMRSVLAGIDNAARLASAREAQLRTALDAQRTRVLELRRARDQATLLTRDVEGAQKALDASRERQRTSRLESQIAQSNISVLTAAVPAAKPTFPRLKLNLAIAAVLGTLLGSGIALGREVTDRRVRGADDLRAVPDVPVLAILGRATIGRARLAAPPAPAQEGALVHHDAPAGRPVPRVTGLLYPTEFPTTEEAGATAGTIGKLMVQQGKLTADELERIVARQRETALGFVDAARQLKLLTEDEVSRAVARHFDYPLLAAGQPGLSEELITIHAPHTREIETLRTLRSQLMLRWFSVNGTRRALAIVGCERRGGRSFIAANLAILFAQIGMRTLLIDADLRAPRQHALFGISNTLGFSTLLADQGTPEVLRQVVDLPNLAVLPAGMLPPNPQELLARPTFVNLLGGFNGLFDAILIDTPALDGCADAKLIAARAGGALIVVRQGETRLDVLQAAAAEFGELGAARVGLVLNEYSVA